MASSVQKVKIRNSFYWRFGFTSVEKKRRGLPGQKWFTYSADTFKKSDVERIRDKFEKQYRSGEFDPWNERIEISEDTLSLSGAINGYLESARPRLAPKTHKVYGEYLSTLLDYEGDVPCTQLEVNEWINHSGTWHTRRSRKIIVDQLIKHIKSLGIEIEITTVAHGTRREKAQKNKTYVTLPELEKVLEAVDKHQQLSVANKHNGRPEMSQQKADKMKDALQVMFFMGLRINELLHCRPAWVVGSMLRIGDLPEWNLKDEFIPKSQKVDQPIAIPKEVQEIFDRLSSKPEFSRMFGYKSETWLRRYINDYFAIALPGKKLSPHSLRDSCATYWLNERNVPVQHVQQLLRHEKIQTTMQYVHHNSDAHYRAFQ